VAVVIDHRRAGLVARRLDAEDAHQGQGASRRLSENTPKSGSSRTPASIVEG
jgi:hypothetical protein